MKSAINVFCILLSCICLLISAYIWIDSIIPNLSGTDSQPVTEISADSEQTQSTEHGGTDTRANPSVEVPPATTEITIVTVTTTASTTTVITTGEPIEKMENDAMDRINSFRAENDLPPLIKSDELIAAARARAQDIAASLEYVNYRPDGSAWDSVVPAKWMEIVDNENCKCHELVAHDLNNTNGEAVFTTLVSNETLKGIMLEGGSGFIGLGCTFVPDDPNGNYYYWYGFIVDDVHKPGEYRDYIVHALNTERLNAGLPPLEHSQALSDLATERALEIVSDDRLITKTDRADLAGIYREFADKGTDTCMPTYVIRDFKQLSESDKMNLNFYSSAPGKIGVGYYYKEDDPTGIHYYWVISLLFEEASADWQVDKYTVFEDNMDLEDWDAVFEGTN